MLLGQTEPAEVEIHGVNAASLPCQGSMGWRFRSGRIRSRVKTYRQTNRQTERQTQTDLYAVSQHGLGAAASSLVDLNTLHTAQEDEVQVGIELEVVEQRQHARRRIDGVGQRGRRSAQRKAEDGARVVERAGERGLVAAEQAEVGVELVTGGRQQCAAVARQRPRVTAGTVEELLMGVENSEVIAAQYTGQIYTDIQHQQPTDCSRYFVHSIYAISST